MATIGKDILLEVDWDEMNTTRRSSPVRPTAYTVASDAALEKLMEGVKKQILFFEETSMGYKRLIEQLLVKVKEHKAAEAVPQAENEALRQQVQLLQANVDGLNKRIQELEAEGRAAADWSERAKAVMKASKVRLTELEAQVQAAGAAGAGDQKLAQENASLKEANKKLQKDLQSAVQAHHVAEEERKKEEKKNERLRADVADLMKGSRQQAQQDSTSTTAAAPSSSKGPIVLEGPAEWQRMKDSELRASLEQHRMELANLRAEFASREKELERSQKQVETLNNSLAIKDKTIHTLSTSSQALGQIEDPLSPGLDALEKKQDKLYQDMEMLHENLMLQAAAAEKDDQISALKMEIARLSHK